jgi:hypothetical protein
MQSWILDVFNLLQHSKNKYFNSEIYDDAYLMAQKLKRAMCIWRWDPGILRSTTADISMALRIGIWHTGQEHRWLFLESLFNGQVGYELLSWSVRAQMEKVDFRLSCGSLLEQEVVQGEFQTKAIKETFNLGSIEHKTQKSFPLPCFLFFLMAAY